MAKTKQVQIIENKGRPEWAVIPYQEYLRLHELDEMTQAMDNFQKNLAQGHEELLPEIYANRLIEGESPIRVWREYRGISQAELARQVGISIPYLSQIEHGGRSPSMKVLKHTAQALELSLDDLVS